MQSSLSLRIGVCRPRCDARQTAMQPRQHHNGRKPLAGEEVKAETKFTWCTLQPAHFSEGVDNRWGAQPENVLLTHKVSRSDGAGVID